jgi:hypothetical protein
MVAYIRRHHGTFDVRIVRARTPLAGSGAGRARSSRGYGRSLALEGDRMMDDELWHSLDRAATANMRAKDVPDFYRYRDQLKADGHAWTDDAELILTGYIWDWAEVASAEEAGDIEASKASPSPTPAGR